MFGAYALIRFTTISEDRKMPAVTVGKGVVLMITWLWSFWPGLLLLVGLLFVTLRLLSKWTASGEKRQKLHLSEEYIFPLEYNYLLPFKGEI